MKKKSSSTITVKEMIQFLDQKTKEKKYFKHAEEYITFLSAIRDLLQRTFFTPLKEDPLKEEPLKEKPLKEKPPVPPITKQNCYGCYNDDYNRGLGGATECWSFKSAFLEPRIDVDVDQRPPYNTELAKMTPNCYRRPRHAYIKPDSLDDDGYWKKPS